MSLAGKLNLQGVKEHLSRQPRVGVKSAFTIETGDDMVTNKVTHSSNPQPIFCICVVVVLCVFGIFANQSVGRTPQVKQIDQGLRKILRMPCVTDVNTHCSASSIGGDYVVHLGDCNDVYEFNGIPFTDVLKDAQGNYHVPSSQDMSLTVANGCKTLSATLDTYSIANTQHASKSQADGLLRRIVWITKKCFTDFTLKINNQVVFDQTPVKMIESKPLEHYAAYIYNVNGNVKGAVSVSGRGCEMPINIYTLRG
jgi:hypothetical protein